MAANPLREPLNPEQMALIQVIYEPFGVSGEWPIWQYVDLTLDAGHGFDAATVLTSVTEVGKRSPMSMSYGPIWRQDSYAPPQPDHRIGLTVAGLRHLAETVPLLGAFAAMIRFLVDRQRKLVPSPREVVAASVGSDEIADEVLTASISGSSAPPVDMTMDKLRELLRHEPFLYAAVHQPTPAEPWTVQVPAVLREYRGVVTIDDYLAKVTELVAPSESSPAPLSSGPPDIPRAVDYLDAVWMSRTRSHLFVNLSPASIVRLTQPCGSDEDFNSLMSALADILGQVVSPGEAAPRHRDALERVHTYLTSALEPDAADRVKVAFEMLISLRHIRVSTQHSDARHRAVTAFEAIGLPFPPVTWPQAWSHIAALAEGALNVLREEVHAGLPG